MLAQGFGFRGDYCLGGCDQRSQLCRRSIAQRLPGEHSTFLQVSARAGAFVILANLRFFGQTEGRPEILAVSDATLPIPDATFRRSDPQGGQDLIYKMPRQVSEGKSLNLTGTTRAPVIWQGELSLELELTTGMA